MDRVSISPEHQTIIACCTAQGSGALALIRLSGDQALSIATSMSSLASGKTILTVPSHTIHYGSIRDEHATVIDKVMFISMHSPKTFTGEDVVEITCHNNPFIIDAIISRAIACGARHAYEGEFTRRAVMNNKMDILQAEALNDLIHAQTPQALKKSLVQLEGSFSRFVHDIEQQILHILALSEASFEFLDEEIMFDSEIRLRIDSLCASIDTLLKTYNHQALIRQGLRIALIGSVNAGKSSVFNALLGKNRAIVTDKAGTTRDVIEASFYRPSGFCTLIDTAGLRISDDSIEQEGIRRSREQATQADLIILLYDGSRLLHPEEDVFYKEIIEQYPDKILYVVNKKDLATKTDITILKEPLFVSSFDKESIAELETAIDKKLTDILNHNEVPFLLTQRQYNLVSSSVEKLHDIKTMITHRIEYELLSYHLNDLLAHLSELTGKSISEQAMDAIFKQFCVGK